MCFSASASFVASGGLAAVGVASFRAAGNKHKLLAAVPLMFAVQQAFEGFEQLSLGAGTVSDAFAYGFLFFAFLVWPIYIPSMMFLLDKPRRPFFGVFIGIGALTGVFLASMLFIKPLEVGIFGHSVRYYLDIPLPLLAAVTYLWATCGAFLISSSCTLRWFGAIFFTSAIVATLFFYYTFTSVWCFFAAILSLLIYFYIRNNRTSVRRIKPKF